MNGRCQGFFCGAECPRLFEAATIDVAAVSR